MSRQTLLGRLTFGALVAGSLTFGGVQALAGANLGNACSTGLSCTTRPYDSACASSCIQQYPENGGAHACLRQIGGTGYCCICIQ